MTSPPELLGHGAGYDPLRQRVVLTGGVTKFASNGDTWEWDGAGWTLMTSPIAPPPGRISVLSFDHVRNEMLGTGGGYIAQTWSWNGLTWTQLSPNSYPNPTLISALASDSKRKRIVAFGNILSPPNADTWEWDGTTWILRTPSVKPQARRGHAMCYDPLRQRVVLFGGEASTNGVTFADTWEWDGNTWSAMPSSAAPAPRAAHAMDFDQKSSRVILFGGFTSIPTRRSFDDTWAWDGINWTQLNPLTSPRARSGHKLVADGARGRLVMFGGTVDAQADLGDTWEWDGTNWIERSAPAPYEREEYGLAHDPVSGGVLLFGGTRGSSSDAYDDTWLFDDNGWRKLAPATGAPRNYSHAMVADPVRKRIVLFGGWLGTNQTWEWNGLKWERRLPAHSPPAIMRPRGVYDSTRQRVVIFGEGTSAFSNMWEWDGNDWSRATSTSQPPGRDGYAVGYDPVRQRTIMFGGFANNVHLRDTWEWDGSTWKQRFPIVFPLERAYPAMTFDADRGSLVLHGGVRVVFSNTEIFGDTWEWDGNNWKTYTGVTYPRPRYSHRITYDPVRRQILLFGGRGQGLYKDTWLFRTPNPAWTASFGAGCAGGAGVPVLDSEPYSWPWIGATYRARLYGIGPSPAQHLPFWMLGASRTQWGSIPLPYELSGAGMPGCRLHVNPLAVGPLVNLGGSAPWPVAIPYLPALVGVSLFAQAGVTDADANVLGIVLSNANEWRLGAK